MTIYSWNMLFRNKRLPEALQFIRTSGADIFCLQEVPKEALAYMKALPYHLAHVKEVDFIARNKHDTSYLVILSRWPITRVLPIVIGQGGARDAGMVARILYFLGLWALAQGERHVCAAEIEHPQGVVKLFNLHLSLSNPERRAKELEVSLALHDRSVPAVVCGDFNILEKPHITVLNTLLGGRLGDALRFTRERLSIEERFASYELTNPLRGQSTHPFSRSQLDHILVSKEFKISSAEVVRERHGSDHHPVRAEVALDNGVRQPG